jgi:hypothetical protein
VLLLRVSSGSDLEPSEVINTALTVEMDFFSFPLVWEEDTDSIQASDLMTTRAYGQDSVLTGYLF